jgi:hypothetical protein
MVPKAFPWNLLRVRTFSPVEESRLGPGEERKVG